MTPDRLRYCLSTLGWTQSALADYVGVSDRTVRNGWATGAKPLPPTVAEWLERLVAVHEAYPRPADWAERYPGQRPLPLIAHGARL